MLGPNLASGNALASALRSPQWLLTTTAQRSRRSRALSPAKPAPRSGLSLPHSGCPFTEPPLRVRRSRPASSALRRTGLGPVRPPARIPGIRFSDSGRVNASNPLPAPSVRRSQPLLTPCSPSGLWIPPAQRWARLTVRETCLRETPDLRSLPACGSLVTAADGSPLAVRCVPQGSLFRESLGTISILPRKGGESQIENGRYGHFFRRKFRICFQ